MEKRSVDALWDELSSENECRGVDVSRLLQRSMAASSRTTSGKSTAKKPSSKRRAEILSAVQSASVAATPRLNGVQQREEPFSLPKVLNRLAAEHQSVRKKAALALESHFLDGAGEKQTQSPETDPASESFSELAKPLFKRFNDPVEKVREVCIRLTTRCIAKEEDLLRYLPYLMPAITTRINSQYTYDEQNQEFSRDQFLHDAFKRGRIYVAENQVTRLKPEEPSEEIRLLLLGLIDAVLLNAFERRASSILHAYIFDILVVLVSGVHDDFHEVNITSCRIFVTISNHMVSVMKHFSVAAVRSVMTLLLHRLARVRVAAVESIRALVSCPNVEKCKGSGTEAIVDLIGHRDENVIPVAAFYTAEVRLNYFAKLDQDRNPMVRRAFFTMVSDWILHLPDRYDHESLLLPYLLSAVSDEDDASSQHALETLEVLGERYEREHGEEVLELKQYGVDGKNPTYNYRAPPPEPFLAGRPSLGTRLFVRGRARRFLNPILRELANWQDATRAHAVRLLKCVLVYCEETITVDAHVLVNTFLRTWRGDAALVEQLQQCAELTGRFTAPKTYLPLLLSRIRGDSDVVVSVGAVAGGGSTAAMQTAVALEVLRYLLQGSLDKMVLPHIPELLDTLAQPALVDFESSGMKLALGQLILQITQLLERSGSDAVAAHFLQHGRLTSMERSYAQIFELGSVLAAGSHCPEAAKLACDAMERVVVLESLAGTDALYAKHSPPLLQRVLQELQGMLAVQWSPHCAVQLALEQVLRLAPVSLLLGSPHGARLDTLFRTILQPELPASPLTSSLMDENSSSAQKDSSAVGAAEQQSQKPRRAREKRFQELLGALLRRAEGDQLRLKEPPTGSTWTVDLDTWRSLLTDTRADAA